VAEVQGPVLDSPPGAEATVAYVSVKATTDFQYEEKRSPGLGIDGDHPIAMSTTANKQLVDA